MFLALESIARDQASDSTCRRFAPDWSITWFVNWRGTPTPVPAAQRAVEAMQTCLQ